jgi:hypothetical protein
MAQEQFRQVIAPLGIEVEIIADSPELLSAALECLPDSAIDQREAGKPIDIKLERATGPSSDMSFGIRVEGSRLQLTGPDFVGWADAREGRAACSVPERVRVDPQALAGEIVEPLALFLLTRLGRTPVHAAGVVVGERAVLLSGPSGSGKSSLALAAAERGLGVLSDDAIYVQLDPQLRVWGWPGAIHVFPEDAPGTGHRIRLRAGKLKAAVPPPNIAPSYCESAAVVLLERSGAVALSRVSSEDARSVLSWLEPGFDLLRDQSAAAVTALTKEGAWRLTLGEDPAEAIDLLISKLPVT